MAARVNGSQNFSRSANLPGIGAWTGCCWVRITASLSHAWFPAISVGNTGGNPTCSVGNSDVGASSNWGIYSREVPVTAAFATTPSVGQAVFLAMVSNGSNLLGRQRLWSGNAFETCSVAAPTGTVNVIRVGNSSFDGTDFANLAIWNVKFWDRALSDEELLIESHFARVMFPASLNFHWKLRTATDTSDDSGNDRNATVTGTPTSEESSFGIWMPRRRTILRPTVQPLSASFVSQRGIDVILDDDAVGGYAMLNTQAW